MPIATWSDRLNTGIDLIDAQHRLLFDALNRLDEAVLADRPGPGLDEDLASLTHATIRHFQTEETFMKEIGFPARSRHSDQHRDLILKVRDLQYQQAKGRPVPREVAAFLADCFEHHVREVDMDYVDFFKAADRAFAPR